MPSACNNGLFVWLLGKLSALAGCFRRPDQEFFFARKSITLEEAREIWPAPVGGVHGEDYKNAQREKNKALSLALGKITKPGSTPREEEPRNG